MKPTTAEISLRINYRDELNPQQYAAVSAMDGPSLVLAGAGTGKTRVVTCRIAQLIRHRTRPERILAVTFTNKAAREMLARAQKGLKKGSEEKPEISTIHSLCVRILRRHASRLGYPDRFAIVDRGEQEAAARPSPRCGGALLAFDRRADDRGARCTLSCGGCSRADSFTAAP